jgi:hypothetical protein
MKSVLFLLSLFLAANIAFSDDPYPFSPPNPLDYICAINAQTTHSKIFRSKDAAVRYCKQYGDYCKVSKQGYREWQASYLRNVRLKYSSAVDWADARRGAFSVLADWLSENGLYFKKFSTSVSYDVCHGPDSEEPYPGDDDYDDDNGY